MIALTEFEESRFRFGQPIKTRLAPFAALAGAGALVMALAFRVEALESFRAPLLTGAGALAVIGLLAALWNETLVLDSGARTYRHARGWWPLQRIRAGTLAEVSRIVLRSRERPDGLGGLMRLYLLSLETRHGTLSFCCSEDREEALRIAERLSARLHLPVDDQENAEESAAPDKNGSRMATGVAVVAACAVIGAMLWPVLSGSKPLLPPRAQASDRGRMFERGGDPSSYPFRGSMVQPGEQRSNEFQLGMDLYWGGKYREAERHFIRAVQQSPENAEIYNMLAYAQADQGNLNDALKTALKALSFAPNSGNILDTVAEMYERRREHTKAVPYYERALQKMSDFDSMETHAKFGRTLLALGHKDSAVSHLMRAATDRSGYPRYSRWIKMSRELLQKNGVKIPTDAALPRPNVLD